MLGILDSLRLRLSGRRRPAPASGSARAGDPSPVSTPEADQQRRARGRRPGWAGLLLGMAAAMAVAALSSAPPVESVEFLSQQLRFRIRGPRETLALIVIAELPAANPEDDPDPHAWWEPMLFWGQHYADLIRQSRRFGATWIALDVVPQVPADDVLEYFGARPGFRPDRDFLEAIAQAEGRVILPRILTQTGASLAPHTRFLESVGEANIGFVSQPRSPELIAKSAALYLKAPMILPSFPALVAARVCGRNPGDVMALREMAGVTGPVGDVGIFRINYTLRRILRVSAIRLARGDVTERERRALRGAVVLVGMSGSASNDSHVGADGQWYDGVEVNANAIATLLDGRAIRLWSHYATAGVTLFFGLAVLLAASLLAPGWGVMAVAAVAGVWCVACVAAFSNHDTLMPMAGPLLGMVVPAAVLNYVRAVEEERRRLRIERTFGRYVSPHIRDYLLGASGNERMGGRHQDATILFFDIRGSVAHAQDRDPAAVMDELNALFGSVVPVIDRHGGLLFRYTGDGFLAVFGAPYPVENHAQAALDTAMELVAHVRRLRRPGTGDPWRAGCGLHSGMVACGSLGVQDRAEFTVIGDTVNLAARMEDLNKQLGGEVVLSAETYRRLAVRPALCGPITAAVPGRAGTAAVYYRPQAATDPEPASTRPSSPASTTARA